MELNLTNKQLVLIAAIILVIGLVVGGVTGVYFIKDTPLKDTLTHTDTVTITKEVPIPVIAPNPESEKLIALYEVERDSLQKEVDRWRNAQPEVIKDTVFLNTIQIPITQKTYIGETYTAKVSGYRPSLDYIETKRVEVLKQVTKTVERTYDNEMYISLNVRTLFYPSAKIPMLGIETGWDKGRTSTVIGVGGLWDEKARIYFYTGWKWKFYQRKF